VDLEPGMHVHRCNDGAADCRGRLWAGTMHRQHFNEAGTLYCIDTALQVHPKVPKVTISNGLVWSLDNTRLYYIDSPTRKIQSFLFEEASGAITFEKTVVEIPEHLGGPDGMTIDEEGMLWVAHWGGFGIYRWNPLTASLIEKIELPVPQVSSCAFGGPLLDHLIITTARENMSEDDLKKYPQSGDTFIVQPGVKGIPAFDCYL